MIVTARQLEDLHRRNGSNGRVTLPVRARLTPLAQDWIRQRNIQLGYADPEPASTASSPPLAASQTQPPSLTKCLSLWWSDGPCGPAKAALISQSKELALAPLAVTNDPNHLIDAIKTLARSIHAGTASTGVLLVSHGAAAIVYANRCPSIRAILGTCLESVDQGVAQLAANVLVIEHPYKTLAQVKNLLIRFHRLSSQREPSDVVKRQLQELGTCA